MILSFYQFAFVFQDIAKLRRHILGLISVLQFEKAGLLTTLFSSASESFTNIAKRIGMHYLAPLQCYYSHGLAGHSSLAATQVYTHNTMEKLKKTFEQAHPKA